MLFHKIQDFPGIRLRLKADQDRNPKKMRIVSKLFRYRCQFPLAVRLLLVQQAVYKTGFQLLLLIMLPVSRAILISSAVSRISSGSPLTPTTPTFFFL